MSLNSLLFGAWTQQFAGGVEQTGPGVAVADRSARAAEICLMIYCLLVPVGRPVGFDALGIHLRLGLLDLLTVPAAIVLLVRFKALKIDWPVAFLVSYGFAAVISTLFTTSPELRGPTLLRAVRLCGILLPFLLAATLSFDEKRLDRLIKMFLIGGGTSLVGGLIVWAFHKRLGVNLYVATVLTANDKFETARASGVFGDYIAFGHLAALWFMMALFGIARLSGFRQWAASAGALALTASALVASLSRGALLYLAVAVPALLLAPWPQEWKKPLWKAAVTITCSGALLALIALLWLPGPLEKGLQILHLRLNEVGLSAAASGRWDVATSNRLGNWAEYAKLIGDNPITGIGYKSLFVGKGIPPDNTYLGTLVETGVLGFAALMGFLVSMLRRLIVGARWYPQALLVLALWIGCIVEGITNDFLTFWGTTPALMAMTGAVITASRTDREAHVPVGVTENKGSS